MSSDTIHSLIELKTFANDDDIRPTEVIVGGKQYRELLQSATISVVGSDIRQKGGIVRLFGLNVRRTNLEDAIVLVSNDAYYIG